LHTSPGIPDLYFVILQPLLQPVAWESHANIPALVNLLTSFLEKGCDVLIQKGLYEAFLGIFQKLLASKANDHHGFTLLKSIFEFTPSQSLKSFSKNMFVLILTRIFQSKTPKLTKSFLDFISYIFLLENPKMTIDEVIQTIDSLQAQPLFGGLLENIIIPEFKNVTVIMDRKRTSLAMTRLLTTSKCMQTTHASSW
jgi:exportin-2 (importin alpha re-exporter)